MPAGLRIIAREVRFTVADTPANRKKAQILIEAFSERWADEFPSFCQPEAQAKPLAKDVSK